jgi:Ca-activated chloride channel family protein
VVTPKDLPLAVRTALEEALRLRWSELQFAAGRETLLVIGILLAVSVLAVLARSLLLRKAGRTHIVLPALLPVIRRSYMSGARHGAFVVFLLGLPFFALALADPRTSFRREEASYPGRRIAILVDGSTSMIMKFETTKLRTPENVRTATFFTAVAAAEYFMKLRMNGRYRDLVALLEFGNDAYVVTPFTTDYDNILLSIRLIGDPREWGRFSDAGTTIIQAMEQGTALFETFDFVNAAGNLMLIFSDGRDSQASLNGRTLDDVMAGAREHRIPVYMIRTAFNMELGKMPDDRLWKPAVERTGGRFYAASDEGAILRALADIDKLSPGRIELREYTVQRPRFSGYALAAIFLWIVAGVLKLTVPFFRTFP